LPFSVKTFGERVKLGPLKVVIPHLSLEKKWSHAADSTAATFSSETTDLIYAFLPTQTTIAALTATTAARHIAVFGLRAAA
jgi:hypothetical protein